MLSSRFVPGAAEEFDWLFFKVPFDLEKGPTPEQTLKVAKQLKFPDNLVPRVVNAFRAPIIIYQVQEQIDNMFKMFTAKDVLLLEINPLVETSEGQGCKGTGKCWCILSDVPGCQG